MPAPIAPEAPPRLSTTIGVPRLCWSWGCTTRATWSVMPPGGNGTIRRIGCTGQACAAHCADQPSSIARTTRAIVAIADLHWRKPEQILHRLCAAARERVSSPLPDRHTTGDQNMAETPTFGRYAEIPYDKMTPEQQD